VKLLKTYCKVLAPDEVFVAGATEDVVSYFFFSSFAEFSSTTKAEGDVFGSAFFYSFLGGVSLVIDSYLISLGASYYLLESDLVAGES
jgi:hypothetical protein